MKLREQLAELIYALPMTNAECQWVSGRIGFLSVKEHYQLWAALQRRESLYGLLGKQGDALLAEILKRPPTITVDAISCLLELPYYEVCYPAGSYEELGEYYLLYEAGAPASSFPYTDLYQIGVLYEQSHPGLFIDQCFVAYPQHPLANPYRGNNVEVLSGDGSWSVRLKLASAANSDGVWICLPDYSSMNDGKPDEVALALWELQASSLQECTLLDAKCSLPEVQNLMGQYNSLEDLVRDGNNLGFLLDEHGQGAHNFLEKYHAALTFENCQTLPLALDLGQNLHCYDYLQREGVPEYGRRKLAEQGCVFGDPQILAGNIDYPAYGKAMLEQEGYVPTSTGDYIRRNGQQFRFERTAPEGPDLISRL